MFALKDFAYQDRATGRRVEVRAGQEIDPLALARHQCDVPKLIRTRFVVAEETPSEFTPQTVARANAEQPRKRGRPKKVQPA